jgi:hypothetical protein
VHRAAGPPAAAGAQPSDLTAAQADAAASSDEPAPAAGTAEQHNDAPATEADSQPAAVAVPVHHYDKGSAGP